MHDEVWDCAETLPNYSPILKLEDNLIVLTVAMVTWYVR